MPGLPPAALALFAKAPRPGMVKTRLAAALSPGEAAEFHRLCALSVWQRLQGIPEIDVFLYCDIRWPEFETLAGPARFRLQRGGDLGERMRHCLEELLAGGYKQALIVGSDAPTMPDAQLEEALSARGSAEVVLGPSEDGGFTLIGATRVVPTIFRDVAWSRSDTRAACLGAIAAAGLAVVETSTHGFDVDTPDDLKRLARDPALPSDLDAWLRLRRDRLL